MSWSKRRTRASGRRHGRRKGWVARVLPPLAAALAAAAVLLWFKFPQPQIDEPTDGGRDDGRIESVSSPEENAPKPAVIDEEERPDEIPWEAVPEQSGPRAALPAWHEEVEDRALVRIFDVADGWQVGDRITLEIPQLEQNLTSIVEEIRPGPGVRSYVGTLADEPDGRFVVTVGTKSTLATIITSKGAFEMVAHGEFGWLMPAANMNRNRDYSQPDYYLPGDSRFDPQIP